MSAAPTPGPWWVDDRRAAGGALQIQAKHRGEGSSYCVATVNFWETPEANAALLAAAPDLKAIAEELEGAIDKQTYDERRKADFDMPDDAELCVVITVKQFRALSAAISKATTGDAA